MDERLPKSERLCGRKAMETLFGQGKGLGSGCVRCRYLIREGNEPSRIVVSVPKRLFKRAVRRNLLKRRIREAYRRQKGLLPAGVDLLLVYAAREVMPYADIYECVTGLLTGVAAAVGKSRETEITGCL